jgi:hypothetical protein
MPNNSSWNKAQPLGVVSETQTSLQRRRAFAASLATGRDRTSKVLGISVAVLALVLGGLFGMALSGFGFGTAHVSVLSVGGALVASIAISWVSAVVLQTRWLAAALFALPMAIGILFAAMSHHWWACAVLLVSILIPFAALAIYQFDQQNRQRPAA